VGADLPHDLRGQVAAGLAGLGLGRHVVTVQREVLTQTRRRCARPSQAQRSGAGRHSADLAAGPDAGITADLPIGFQIGQSVQEGFHVGAAQRGWGLAAVGAPTQRLGQTGQAADVVAHVRSAAGVASGPHTQPW